MGDNQLSHACGVQVGSGARDHQLPADDEAGKHVRDVGVKAHCGVEAEHVLGACQAAKKLHTYGRYVVATDSGTKFRGSLTVPTMPPEVAVGLIPASTKADILHKLSITKVFVEDILCRMSALVLA